MVRSFLGSVRLQGSTVIQIESQWVQLSSASILSFMSRDGGCLCRRFEGHNLLFFERHPLMIVPFHVPVHFYFPPYALELLPTWLTPKFPFLSILPTHSSKYLYQLPHGHFSWQSVKIPSQCTWNSRPHMSHENHSSSDFHTSITGSHLLLTDSGKCALSFDLSFCSANHI